MKPVQKQKLPQVSVIMPVHNTEQFLSEAVESILSQTFSDFELTIVDDHSGDRSWEMIKDLKGKDRRIKAFRNSSHMGVGATLNLAIKKSRGKFLARADSDDLMLPTRLEEQYKFLTTGKNKIVAVGSWCLEIDKFGNRIGERVMPVKHGQIAEMMFYLMGMQNPTIMFNRTLIPNSFPWCKTTGFVDDIDLLFKLLPYGHFANIPKFLVKYRIHDNNTSLKHPKNTFYECQLIRNQAVLQGLYTPTSKAKFLRLLENIVVAITPETQLLGLYKLCRKVSYLGIATHAT